MKGLSQIINNLRNSEIRFIRKIYSAQPNGEDQKRLRLFELALAEKELTDKYAAQTLYGQDPNSAYSHVKNRLKNDILNFLLIQDVSKKNFTKLKQIELNCRKAILQGEMLIMRGLYDEGEKLLLKTFKKAIEHELFSDIVKIKHVLRIGVGFRKGMKEYEKHTENLDYYFQEYGKFLKATDYYYRLIIPNQFITNKTKEYLSYSEAYSKELDACYTEDSSARFTFLYLLFKIYHNNLLHDFKTSLKYALQLVEFTGKDKKNVISTNNNRCGAHFALATVYTNLRNYEASIEAALYAVNNFRAGLVNQLRAMEHLFFAYLRNENFDKAKELIAAALKHKSLKTNKLLKARWLFFEANLMYIFGEQNLAFKLLRKNNDLLKDKSGWLFGFKLLEMMLTIDEKDWYWLGYQLNNFNQLLSRQQGKANIHRAKVIGQIIRSLLTNGGDFEITLVKAASRIKILEESKDDHYWDPTGYEIIRFDEWIKSKSKRRGKD